jgi:hypothetical protein
MRLKSPFSISEPRKYPPGSKAVKFFNAPQLARRRKPGVRARGKNANILLLMALAVILPGDSGFVSAPEIRKLS